MPRRSATVTFKVKTETVFSLGPNGIEATGGRLEPEEWVSNGAITIVNMGKSNVYLQDENIYCPTGDGKVAVLEIEYE